MLNLENINQRFGSKQILENFSQSFAPNRTTVILGPSGAGKSTVLRTLNLLNLPQSGKYNMDNETLDFSQKIPDKLMREFRLKTGMVFQRFELFANLNVLENIKLAPTKVLKENDQSLTEFAKKLLNQVGLANYATAYPSQLSGGQAQRVAIARMMAMKPEYMLFDEPTSALDPESEKEVVKIILDLAKSNNSMVVVTHNMSFAHQIADDIVFMENGQVEFYGTCSEFFAKPTRRIEQFLEAMVVNV